MKDGCLFCEARERMEREWIERNGKPEEETGPPRRIIDTCECGGVKRFIAYGLQPTTEEEARELFCALMEWFGLNPAPGVARFVQVLNALDEHEALDKFAHKLGVGKRKAEELAKWATGKTFRKYHADKNREKESRMFSQLDPVRKRRRSKPKRRRRRS